MEWPRRWEWLEDDSDTEYESDLLLIKTTEIMVIQKKAAGPERTKANITLNIKYIYNNNKEGHQVKYIKYVILKVCQIILHKAIL